MQIAESPCMSVGCLCTSTLSVCLIILYKSVLYSPLLKLSSLPCEGNGIPKVVNLEVDGELVEGNIIKGHAKVAWCGGTPGKGVARYKCHLK